MREAIAYIRVSSRSQKASGFGLQSQEARVRSFAEAAGYTLVHIFRETKSAITSPAENRPELQKTLKYARERRVPIVITELNRLARKASELERLVLNSGVEVVVADSSLEKHIIMTVKATQVEIESEMLVKRTKAGLVRAQQRGVLLGNRTNLPVAQKIGAAANAAKALARDDQIAAIILGAKRAIPAEIAEQLNAAGYRTPQGKPWNAANIRRPMKRILRRQMEIERPPLYGTF